ncbi:MAG TPA: carboxypeptidase-like regulatory domain-containing protein [Bryobacteraceae bacterium]
MRRWLTTVLVCLFPALLPAQNGELRGVVTDPQTQTVAGATLHLGAALATSNSEGEFHFTKLTPGIYKLTVEAPGFAPVAREVTILPNQLDRLDVQFAQLSSSRQSIVITAKSLEPTIDLRNAEVFNRTLFTRDDQIFQQLNAGINAGQHEGGGKSLEIRRSTLRLHRSHRRRPRETRHSLRLLQQSAR